VALIFRDFYKSTGQNKTKRTLLERVFNLASDDVISADNKSLLTMLSAEMTFRVVLILQLLKFTLLTL